MWEKEGYTGTEQRQCLAGASAAVTLYHNTSQATLDTSKLSRKAPAVMIIQEEKEHQSVGNHTNQKTPSTPHWNSAELDCQQSYKLRTVLVILKPAC